MQVALGITGCIAAYKSIEVMRDLQKAGVSVRVVLTRAATRFVGPLTFEALSGQSVITGMFGPGRNREILHIRAAQEADLLAVVPATADILGKFAHGIADDFLSTLYLSFAAPVLIAPAMNVEMWNHPAVRHNLEILKSRGHHIVEPETGVLACGTVGQGRLAEVGVIVEKILALLRQTRDLEGIKVLVTAGPTVEDLDPVRFLSNRSSGKMGYAVAAAARARGARVVLVSGPTALPEPEGILLVRVRSAAEMKEAVLRHFPEADIVVKAAAVSDYRPARCAPQKIKKETNTASLELIPNEDILALLGARKGSRFLVGFAAETEELIEHAREKMARKNLDLVVVNDVSSGVFGEDRATVQLLSPSGEVEALRDQCKRTIADRILDAASRAVAARPGERSSSQATAP